MVSFMLRYAASSRRWRKTAVENKYTFIIQGKILKIQARAISFREEPQDFSNNASIISFLMNNQIRFLGKMRNLVPIAFKG